MTMLVKKEVPSDGSCLFASVDFCLNGSINKARLTDMRNKVAERILRQIEYYKDKINGEPSQ